MAKRILVLGVTGMLGHVLFKELSKVKEFDVFGTTRNIEGLRAFFTEEELGKIRSNVDADNFDTVIRAFASIQPDIIINCIGIIKQLPISNDPLTAITVNAQLPHRISLVARSAGARLIHISTDCVFNGQKGSYTEQDPSDATDLYGRSKYLGEVAYPHCVTLRTSIIGHELKSNFGLVDWFINQSDSVNGYTKAIYSGFSTLEMANVILNYVIPNETLSGVYHVSSNAISKYELLKIISSIYDKKINIQAYDDFILDRSMESSSFRNLTNYTPPSWHEMVAQMQKHYINEQCYSQKRVGK
jgi:dTDP-4-dehydrorhamnose reductase